GHTIQLGCGICLAVGSALGPVAVPSLASNPCPPFGVREAPTFASPSRASWCFALSLFVRFGRLRHTATLQDSVLAQSSLPYGPGQGTWPETHLRRHDDCAARGDRRQGPSGHGAARVPQTLP